MTDGVKITIIGLGYVGLSLAAFLGTKVNVVGVDSNDEKIRSLTKGRSYFYEPNLDHYLKRSIKKGLEFECDITDKSLSSDFIFVTVGTPINKKGKIDLMNIKKVAHSIAENMPSVKNRPLIIIKSTVIPGTTMQVIKPILEKNNFNKIINNRTIKTIPIT